MFFSYLTRARYVAVGLLFAGTMVACDANLSGPQDQPGEFLAEEIDTDVDLGGRGNVATPSEVEMGGAGIMDQMVAPDPMPQAVSGGEGAVATNLPQCSDGIDNDGDGLIDVQMDLGCSSASDTTERARPRAEEDGFSTFDLPAGSRIVYVAANGSDNNNGLSSKSPVKTIKRGASLIRNGTGDFLLLRRGDSFYHQTLGSFVSGASADKPVVVASYGTSNELPRIYVNDFFVNHNGSVRNYVVFKDLHLIVEERIPNTAKFTGAGNGFFRFVGGGAGLLIEGCHLEYGEIVIQSYGATPYRNAQVRRNVIEKSYHSGTCAEGNPNGNSKYRPSGIYSSHVEGLTIEENFFDHNGWNAEVSDACATMYNHNMYLSETNDLTVVGNLSTRPSSMHVKLRSDVTSGMKNVRIDNNHFVEGEIGVSMGGNTKSARRFTGGTVVNNVMSDIGRTRPTTRNLAWGIELRDVEAVDITDNLILNQRASGVTNSYGIYLSNGTANALGVTDNILYRIQGKGLWMASSSLHKAIDISSNTIVDPEMGSCLVRHDGSFGPYDYYADSYFSGLAGNQWVCIGTTRMSLSQWMSKSQEGAAEGLTQQPFPNPQRTLETYSGTLGIGSNLTSFIGKARLQTRFNWNGKFTAAAINSYVRKGFGR